MIAVLAALGACGGDGGSADDQGPQTTAASDTTNSADMTVDSEAVPTSGAGESDGSSDAAEWEEIVPGGDCQCSDGSAYNLWLNEGDPEKVVLYLEDGGACFSAETCAPDSGVYKTTVTEHPAGEGGIFDYSEPRNPLADWSVVYAPYCSGDVFLGNATTEYAPGLTIHHNGYANGTAAVNQLVASFPNATEVIVIGESAGSVAAPLYAGLVSDRLPDADVIALADGSGSYPDTPEINALIADVWGTGDAIPDWPENAGLTDEQWSSFPGLFVQSGRHDPDIVFARHDYAYDERQQMWYPYLGIDAPDLLALIDANETQIEAAGIELLSYIAPGDDHTLLTEEELYTEEVGGVTFLDWLTRLVAGEPVTDVHCAECAAG